jgi:uncharacterized damage-inducible protein DinB
MSNETKKLSKEEKRLRGELMMQCLHLAAEILPANYASPNVSDTANHVLTNAKAFYKAIEEAQATSEEPKS